MGRASYYSLLTILIPSLYYAALHIHDVKFWAIIPVSIFSYILTRIAIPAFMQNHLRRGLSGKDINKKDGETIPESMGLQSCACYLIGLIIIASFSKVKSDVYPALVSITITTLLGFADDVLDIRWSVKIMIPLLTVLPMVLEYNGSTTICPKGFLKPITYILNFECIDVGFLYLIFMALFSVFCTHCINIYAGINGLEAGQSFVVACFLLFHAIQYWETDSQAQAAASILIPFIATTFALLHFNWYPSKVFVGDTFTLTSGATIAAAGILGHFTEMTLLFMGPQILNFVMSLPQLFGIIKCPRHRLPKLNPETGKLEGNKWNLNVVNYWLLIFGPRTESRLCIELLLFQVATCIGAYGVRFIYNQRIIL